MSNICVKLCFVILICEFDEKALQIKLSFLNKTLLNIYANVHLKVTHLKVIYLKLQYLYCAT